MPTTKPYAQADEKYDIINNFGYDGTANRGTFVKISTGWTLKDETNAQLGDVGNDFSNVVSELYGVTPRVTAAGTGDDAIGMLYYDVKETDENGMPLKFTNRKAAAINAVRSGQAVPILTRGIVAYSGINGTPAAGGAAYVSGDGEITAVSHTGAVRVGTFLGAKDADGYAVLKVNIQY
jgi:hypothetical protein